MDGWAQEIREGRDALGISQSEFGRRVARLIGQERPVRLETVSRWERTGKPHPNLKDAIRRVIRGEGAPPVDPSCAIASREPRPAPRPTQDAARRAEALARLRAAVEEVAALCRDDSEGEGLGRPEGGRP